MTETTEPGHPSAQLCHVWKQKHQHSRRVVSSVNFKKNNQTWCLTISVFLCSMVGQGGVLRPPVAGKLRSAGHDSMEIIQCQLDCGHLASQQYQTVKVAPSRGWKLMLAEQGCSFGAVDQTACTCEQLSSQAEVSKPSIPRGSGKTGISLSSHQMYHLFPCTKTSLHMPCRRR